MAARQNINKACDNLKTLQHLVDRATAELAAAKVAANEAIATSLKVMADADNVLARRP